jgi:hypothetical protein
VNWPSNWYLDKPEELSLGGVRNLYIQYHSNLSKQDIKLGNRRYFFIINRLNNLFLSGVWHLLPHKYRDWKNLAENRSIDDVFDSLLANSERPVILYAHGSYFFLILLIAIHSLKMLFQEMLIQDP